MEKGSGLLMEMKNEYGEIIAYERSLLNISAQKLCDGLCSVAHLQRIESGERFCEKILADALLQRLGVSSDKFTYILNEQEQNSIILKEKIEMLVENQQREEAYLCMEEYRKLTQKKSVLHKQFCLLAEAVLEWKDGRDSQRVLKLILEAWNLTKKGKSICVLKGQYFSFFEIALAMLYMRLLEDNGEEEAAKKGYEEMLFYLDKYVDIQDRAKWYPQAAYRLLLLLKKSGNEDRKLALQISEKTLALLRKQASLNYLLEILEEYSELLKKEYRLETERLESEKLESERLESEKLKTEKLETEKLKTEELEPEKIPPDRKKRLLEIDLICESLHWLYKEYGIKHAGWLWNSSFGEVKFIYVRILYGEEELGWESRRNNWQMGFVMQ